MRILYLITTALALLPTIASASETVTYSYDAKGRLTQVLHSGGPNDGAVAAYSFDAADNRTSVTTTGFHSGVVVVPLNAFTVIPLSSGG